MWVKICGNTNLKDAALAAELGADAVGFVFAASKRQVTAAQVAAITARLPAAVERVGVFDSRDAEAIATTAYAAGLTAVQLHGGFDEALLKRLAGRFANDAQGIRIIQTLHWSVGGHTESPVELLVIQLERVAATGAVDRVLIDSRVGASAGGTGMAFNWAAARRLFAQAPSGVQLIVAGGLTLENVAEAIGELAPWGVDVSSGVEVSVGRKDPDRLALFINHARAASTA